MFQFLLISFLDYKIAQVWVALNWNDAENSLTVRGSLSKL